MLEPGTTLGRYRLADRLGEGGMGVVWRATDTSLGRDVAIKVLPDALAANAERLARFDREARLLASLNHPNIAAVYGLEHEGDLRYLVMELVPGQDLSQRLAAGPLGVTDTVQLGLQLAGALEAAHDSGVIHRDLKPANIQVTDPGDVKVLDFGLAKAFETESSMGNPTLAPTATPTVTSAGSRAGFVIGTAAYMSPEQARGKELDKRTDIWSFGCVLFECLTGRALFAGETVSDTLASILRNEPDWSLLPAAVPPRLRELLGRCLDKDARNRLRDIGDARIDLEALVASESTASGSGAALAGTGQEEANVSGSTSGSAVRSASPPRRAPWLPALAAGLVGAAVGIGAWSAWSGDSAPAAGSGPTRLTVNAPAEWVPFAPRVSPDGRKVVFSAWHARDGQIQNQERLYVRDLGSFEAVEVPSSQGVEASDISPDGTRVAFVAPVSLGSSQRQLFTAPLDGSSAPVALSEWDEDWGDDLLWHPDGDFILQARSPRRILRIAPDGRPRPEEVVLQLEGIESVISLNAVSVDGAFLLADGQAFTDRRYVIHVVAIDLANGESSIVVEDGQYGQERASGQLLFSRRDQLLVVPFDRETRQAVGAPEVLESGMRTTASWNSADYHISDNGTLAYRPGGRIGTARQLAFFHDDGQLELWSDERRSFEGMMGVSPDGRRVAVVISGAGTGQYEIWISEIDRPRLRRFVGGPAHDFAGPTWHPDSQQLAYNTVEQGGDKGIFLQSTDGGEPQLVWQAPPDEFAAAASFTADGQALICYHRSASGRQIVQLDLSGDFPVEPRVLIPDATWARLSPDGRWLAYASHAAGDHQVFLRRYENGDLAGPEVPVSDSGGRSPHWNKQVDGGRMELWYWKESRAMLVDVETKPELSLSSPREGDYNAIGTRTATSDFLPDGRRLVVLHGPEETYPTELSVVLDAFAGR